MKHEQKGPPVRIGAYQVRVIEDDVDHPHAILAEAILVDNFVNKDWPMRIHVTPSELSINASNVATDSLVEIPNDVLTAVLKVGGWEARRK